MKSQKEIVIPDQKFLIRTRLVISKNIGPGIAAIEKPIIRLSSISFIILKKSYQG